MINLVTEKKFLKYLRSYDLDFYNLLREQKKLLNTKSSQDLLKSSIKRFIFYEMYKNIIYSSKKLKILDIGGSLHLLSKLISDKHDYILCDTKNYKSQTFKNAKIKMKFYNCDWYYLPKFKKNSFDIIISNDLFPNVDQRLSLFLSKFVKYGKKLIMSLTCTEHKYNKFYQAKRLDKNEILTILPYNKDNLFRILRKNKINVTENSYQKSPNLFHNGRNIYILEL